MRMIVDGVCFQKNQTHGIARVWRSLLQEWGASAFGEHVLLLDRGDTAPAIPGMRRRLVPTHSYERLGEDRAMLQQVCDEEGATVFMSTYYSAPLTTPALMMVYDMTPEVLKADLDLPVWREKETCIRNARHFVAISRNTSRDLLDVHPDIDPERISIALPGVATAFHAASAADLDTFRRAQGIRKPYFMLVGRRGWYKNADAFFSAYSMLPQRVQFGIVCVGGNSVLAASHQALCRGSDVHLLHLDDHDLSLAYGGAIALVYPSLHEGFGLPIVEAMASGCPVITTPSASLPEAAGDAALYVNPADRAELTRALLLVQEPVVRASLIAKGLERARLFSWTRMAQSVELAARRAASDGSMS